MHCFLENQKLQPGCGRKAETVGYKEEIRMGAEICTGVDRETHKGGQRNEQFLGQTDRHRHTEVHIEVVPTLNIMHWSLPDVSLLCMVLA